MYTYYRFKNDFLKFIRLQFGTNEIISEFNYFPHVALILKIVTITNNSIISQIITLISREGYLSASL